MMKELRCGFCNRLLGKITIKTAIEKGSADIKVEVKCKCRNLNTFEEKVEAKKK